MRDKGYAVSTALLVIVALTWCGIWFSHKEVVRGEISGKWVETHTSCDKDGCTTTHSYLFQLKDGRIFKTLWGTYEWDRLQAGDKVEFVAYGFETRFFGFRGLIQDATDFRITG